MYFHFLTKFFYFIFFLKISESMLRINLKRVPSIKLSSLNQGESSNNQNSSPVSEEKEQGAEEWSGAKHIMQWYYNFHVGEEMVWEPSGTPKYPTWIRYIRVIVGGQSAEIEAQVVQESGANVEICLHSNKSFENHFEAKSFRGSKVDGDEPQCAKYDYQTILNENRDPNQRPNYRFLIKAKIGLVPLAAISFDRQFFLAIIYKSDKTKKSIGIWELRRGVKFEFSHWKEIEENNTK